jgi:hypothetical protein
MLGLIFEVLIGQGELNEFDREGGRFAEGSYGHAGRNTPYTCFPETRSTLPVQ